MEVVEKRYLMICAAGNAASSSSEAQHIAGAMPDPGTGRDSVEGSALLKTVIGYIQKFCFLFISLSLSFSLPLSVPLYSSFYPLLIHPLFIALSLSLSLALSLCFFTSNPIVAIYVDVIITNVCAGMLCRAGALCFLSLL